jgi:putative ABC transport system permease protein
LIINFLKIKIMLLNNLKLTIRRFNRQKLNTGLHIIGLTLGITVCLLIGLFSKYEMTFDAYHDKADRIYRINSIWSDAGKMDYHYSTPLPLSRALRTEISGIEKVALAHPQGTQTIVEISPEKRFAQEHILIVEPEFLDIFNVEILRGGDGHEMLRQPFQAILSEMLAEKFYSKENPIGKTFLYKNQFNVTVVGLMKDLPTNTHLPASMLLSYVPDPKYLGTRIDRWTSVSGTTTLVVLPKNANLNSFTSQLNAIADKYINPKMPSQSKSYFDIQPLSDVHFNTKYAGGGGWVKAVNTKWLWFFGIIGLAVLALACINFINLSTAQSMTRVKEIGVRKTIGAGQAHLIRQFLFEAFTLTTISGILSLIITYLSLPSLNIMLEKGITFDFFQTPVLWGAFVLGIVLTSLLAGTYPAWVIARFKPVSTLKTGNAVAGNPKTTWLRKGLVVTQFTISVGLLIAVALMAQQVQFLRHKDLGFDKDNIVNVDVKDAQKVPVLAAELRQIPQVKDFSFATAPPSTDGHWGTIMTKTNGEDPNRWEVTQIFCDDNYAKMYGLKLSTGRFNQISDTIYTSNSLPSEKKVFKVVVNEKLLETLSFGTPSEAIGKRFWADGGNIEIVGVVANFSTSSLHEAMKPMLMTPVPQGFQQVGIKIEAESDVPLVIAAIEKAWKKTFPEGIFDFKFLDEEIDAFYKAEIRLYSLFKVFAGLAMLISCLGLWGLASFAAQQRTKEIGIRKVLGASVAGIATLLSKDFLKLVLISILVASPIAWLLMHKWLQNFAYRISIGWWVFVLVGFVAVLIALLTVSFQAIKAALTNPVKSLRSE